MSLFPKDFGLMTEAERLKHYSQFTPEQYWSFLTNDEGTWELTTKEIDWQIVGQLASSIGAQQHGRSFFVTNVDQVKHVMKHPIIKQYKANVYIGENPRIQTWKRVQRKSDGQFFTFKAREGKNISVQHLRNIFIDIDALHTGLATEQQLQRAIEVAENIDEAMLKEFGAGKVIALLSGNGVQLIYLLDTPISWPALEYEIKEHDVLYKENPEYIRAKEITKEVIGKLVNKLQMRGEEKIAHIDNTWDIRRVGRLPFTKNYKYHEADGNYRWCGIVCLRDEDNTGFAEKLLSRHQLRFKKEFAEASAEYTTTVKKLRNEPLVQLLLRKELPSGARNHYLELQFSLLLRDSQIDPAEVHDLIEEINLVQRKKINPVCYLDEKNHFSKSVVNTYCAIERLPPEYPVFDMKPRDSVAMKLWDECDVSSKSLANENLDRFLDRGEDCQTQLSSPQEVFEFVIKKRLYYKNTPFLLKSLLRVKMSDADFEYYEKYWFKYLWAQVK